MDTLRGAGSRAVALVAAAVMGATILAAGLAWACTEQPSILGVGPAVGQAGYEVAVSGNAKVSSAPVDIRWNAADGVLVGRTMTNAGGSFATSLTVPDVEPGVYSIVAVTSGVNMARMAYEVTGPVPAAASSQVAPSLWSDGSEAGATIGSSSTSTATLVGAGLLSAGLVVLFAGFGLVAVRRRRVTA